MTSAPPDSTAVPELSGRWELHPSVSVRPEPFGALLYHFGTRQLSFLKDRRLVQVLSRLRTSTSPRTACIAAGIGDAELPAFEAALARLAVSTMIVPLAPVPA